MMSSGGLTRRLLLGAIADQEPETKRTSSRPSLFGEFPESSVETAGQLVPEGGPLPGCVWAVVKYPQRFGSLPQVVEEVKSQQSESLTADGSLHADC